MLMFTKIANLIKLWDAHWVHLTDDLLYVMRYQVGNVDMHSSSIELQNFGLLEIEHILNRNGTS